jgi:hypothetical protein
VVTLAELNLRHTAKRTRRRYRPAEIMRAPRILIVDDEKEDEMALHVLAYNIKRMISILGVGGLMDAIRV